MQRAREVDKKSSDRLRCHSLAVSGGFGSNYLTDLVILRGARQVLVECANDSIAQLRYSQMQTGFGNGSDNYQLAVPKPSREVSP